jgi:hypothetical protein
MNRKINHRSSETLKHTGEFRIDHEISFTGAKYVNVGAILYDAGHFSSFVRYKHRVYEHNRNLVHHLWAETATSRADSIRARAGISNNSRARAKPSMASWTLGRASDLLRSCSACMLVTL